VVKATWGTHTYPTSRTYDLQGRMKTLSTYRNVPAAQLESATLDSPPTAPTSPPGTTSRQVFRGRN